MTSMVINPSGDGILYEDMLSRMFGYLRHGGSEISREATLNVLKLARELLAADTPDVMEQAIVELPKWLEQADIEIPLSCPPISRSSIRYHNA